jgi:hypothetical protein
MVSVPDTWVTVYSGDMGDNLGPKRVVEGLQHFLLQIEVAEVVVAEADEIRCCHRIPLRRQSAPATAKVAELIQLPVEVIAVAHLLSLQRRRYQ